jgi:hypothetical protein
LFQWRPAAASCSKPKQQQIHAAAPAIGPTDFLHTWRHSQQDPNGNGQTRCSAGKMMIDVDHQDQGAVFDSQRQPFINAREPAGTAYGFASPAIQFRS